MANVVRFTVNGQPIEINTDTTTTVNASTRLAFFIRDEVGLKGTKVFCAEGGCGACLVNATTTDPVTGNQITRSVNSCLVPVLSCNGWAIETVESLGNRREGYDPIQQRLVQFGGTQCGFCSSGMVMNMYSLRKAKGDSLTMQQIEDNFDGNICRCTGFRPILDAFKSFAVDAPSELKAKVKDMEDIMPTCIKKKSCGVSNCCQNSCKSPTTGPSPVELQLPGGVEWVKATDLANTFEAINRFATAGTPYRVVGGNTGTGVFKREGPYRAYIDVNDVVELRRVVVSTSAITLGGGNTLSLAIDILQTVSTQPGFEYTEGLSKHLRRVANTSVRNLATLSGNLMLKHDHPSFPSDVFVILETVGAQLNIGTSSDRIQAYDLVNFLTLDMTGKLIVSITLPQRVGYTYRSFKIARRPQNDHAYVSAGFLFRVDPANNYRVLEKPRIVYSGIRPDFIHASQTEALLEGMELGSLQSLQTAEGALAAEIDPEFIPPEASAEYRKKLAQSLFYKAILGILGTQVSGPVSSGGEDLPHLLTRGEQVFDQDTGDSPLYKPVTKLEAPAQVSGEAVYVNDIPAVPGELFGMFVLSKQANCTLASVDASQALAVPGVVAFYQAKDIPGKNNNMGIAAGMEAEPLFVEDRILYAGQAIGLLVAVDRSTCYRAVGQIRITYSDIQKPVIDIDDAINQAKCDGSYEQILRPSIKSAQGSSLISALSNFVMGAPRAPTHTITGEYKIGSQAHIQMETHITLVKPNERGLDVYSSTQWMDQVQSTIAEVLNIPNNTINVEVRRLGGAYGSKISRAAQTAAAAALAAHLLGKPVRVAMDLETNLAAVGKRFPFKVNYEVGCDDNGKIEQLNVTAICDQGAYGNERVDDAAVLMIQNCYQANGWTLTPGAVKTNTPPNTWVRAPGSVKGIAIVEIIMDHIAHELNKDPVEVRRVNLIQEGDPIVIPAPYETFTGPNLIPEMLEEMEASAQYSARKAAVEEFNKANRWLKRGIALCPMRYAQQYGAKYGAYVAIYHTDGTVVVSHAGIEVGQGLNTKVAQVVAYELGIPLEKVEIRPSNTVIGANSDTTGGAMTSELVAYAALRCGQTLRERIEAVKKEKKMDKATWEELIAACHGANVDLRATYLHTPLDPPKPYDIWGVNAVEVEIDCLTGELRIIRSDIIQDLGKSLSPEVDIGQVEGAYIMGMGFWLKERLVYDENTGELLTKNTWEYKIPFPKCIPEDFRVKLVSNRPNPLGVLGSKASGEAPICLTITIVLALRNAIAAARKDAGQTGWFRMDFPLLPDDIMQLCLTDPSQFIY